ncbi:MAG: undecaprenyl-diphosphate phosphatase [bacterium]|nr:MAG: undecaprenyl-diphosphate phosphatase [bacterium]
MFESILLGILQGLTEFLPVSSSGHLVLAQEVLSGFGGPAAAFDVLLHGGTLAAVLFYFRGDVAGILRDAARPAEGGWRLPALLILATIPAGVVGLLLAERIEPLFSSPKTAALGLVATGGILTAAWRMKGKGRRSLADITVSTALLIGLAQALAIVPGISRSGSTIAVGMFAGMAGREAARFSFLLSIPAVAGALFLEFGALVHGGFPLSYLAGALSAALVGWAAIAFLMRLLDRENLLPFAVYCLALGSLSLLILI